MPFNLAHCARASARAAAWLGMCEEWSGVVCVCQAEVARWRKRAEAADAAARKVEGRAAAAEAAAGGASRDARAAQEQVRVPNLALRITPPHPGESTAARGLSRGLRETTDARS